MRRSAPPCYQSRRSLPRPHDFVRPSYRGMVSSMKPLIVVALAAALSPRAAAGDVDWGSVAEFALGACVSVAVHEGAHWLTGEMKHKEIAFHGLHWDYIQDGDYSNTVQLAGLIGSAICAETALHETDDDPRPFWDGLLIGASFEELTYPTLRAGDWDGDWYNLQLSSPGKELWGAAFVAHFAYSLKRMQHKGRLDPRVWFDMTGEGPALGFRCEW